jgi:hypothetical protein
LEGGGSGGDYRHVQKAVNAAAKADLRMRQNGAVHEQEDLLSAGGRLGYEDPGDELFG